MNGLFSYMFGLGLIVFSCTVSLVEAKGLAHVPPQVEWKGPLVEIVVSSGKSENVLHGYLIKFSSDELRIRALSGRRVRTVFQKTIKSIRFISAPTKSALVDLNEATQKDGLSEVDEGEHLDRSSRDTEQASSATLPDPDTHKDSNSNSNGPAHAEDELDALSEAEAATFKKLKETLKRRRKDGLTVDIFSPGTLRTAFKMVHDAQRDQDLDSLVTRQKSNLQKATTLPDVLQAALILRMSYQRQGNGKEDALRTVEQDLRTQLSDKTKKHLLPKLKQVIQMLKDLEYRKGPRRGMGKDQNRKRDFKGERARRKANLDD